jgi:hypothetical protein
VISKPPFVPMGITSTLSDAPRLLTRSAEPSVVRRRSRTRSDRRPEGAVARARSEGEPAQTAAPATAVDPGAIPQVKPASTAIAVTRRSSRARRRAWFAGAAGRQWEARMLGGPGSGEGAVPTVANPRREHAASVLPFGADQTVFQRRREFAADSSAGAVTRGGVEPFE